MMVSRPGEAIDRDSHDRHQGIMDMVRRVELALRIPVLALCAWFIVLLTYSIARRIAYPFELEWLEGDMLLTAMRLLEHGHIYTPPSADYIPSIYPPFYYMVIAAAFRLFEPSLPVLRGVSLLALLGIFTLLYHIVYRETQRHWLALLSMGLFASFYNHHASWYDIGRVDSLFYFLLLLGIRLASQTHRGIPAAVISATVLCLALFTKQSALVYLPFVAAYLFFKNRPSSMAFLAVFASLSVIFFLVVQATSDGWFAFYTIINPLSFPKRTGLLNIFVWNTKFFALIIIMFTAGIVLLMRGRPWEIISLWEITLIPSLIAYLRVKPIIGTYANDSMYISLWLSLLVPLWLKSCVLNARLPYRYILGMIAWALLCFQLISMRYDPGRWIPAPGSAAKGKELLARLRSAAGPVFVHQHPVYAWMAGKEPSMTPCNLWAYNLGEKRHYVPEDLFARISNGYFAVIVLDDSSKVMGEDLVALVKSNYVLESTIQYPGAREFASPVGFRARPQTVWVPK